MTIIWRLSLYGLRVSCMFCRLVYLFCLHFALSVVDSTYFQHLQGRKYATKDFCTCYLIRSNVCVYVLLLIVNAVVNCNINCNWHWPY